MKSVLTLYAKVILIGLFVLSTLLSACGERKGRQPWSGLPEDPLQSGDCILVAGAAMSGDTVTVALFEPVRPANITQPRTISEEILFSHLYESLIEIDCSGKVLPALAESWRSYRGGRKLVFTLRRRARFSDGTPVRPEDVIRSWPVSQAGADSVYRSGEREITMLFEEKQPVIPGQLASPAYAVFKVQSGDDYSPGTGPYKVSRADWNPFEEQSELILEPVLPGSGPVIRMIKSDHSGARDLLESETDLMITTDPSVISYASLHGEYLDIPLYWRDTYILLSTSRINALRWDRDVSEMDEGFCARLAADAVRFDARACTGESWWEDISGSCLGEGMYPVSPLSLRGADPDLHERRIAFHASDPVARDIAGRIVALAAGSASSSEDAALLAEILPGIDFGNRPFATGFSRHQMAASLRRGEDFAYILKLPSRTVAPCRAIREFVTSAPYLAGLGGRFNESILPLVETRPHMIVRKGTVTVGIGAAGMIRITSPPSRRQLDAGGSGR